MDDYDLESVYDAEISPLLKEIISICKKHKIPMLASFAYAMQEDGGVDMSTTYQYFDDRKPDNFECANKEIRREGGAIAMTIRKN